MNNNEFLRAMAALPEPPSESKPPFWDYWRHDLWEKTLLNKDPEGFFGWPCVYHTMRLGHWPGATEKEYERLFSDNPDLLLACEMPDFGYPKDYYREKYSAALIHQAHHLYQWMKFSERDLSNFDSIFEFGGGYGAMALVARRYGFRGSYHIYDLPEFMLLQKYFLSNTGINDVYWFDPPKVIHPKKGRYDLFIACFSLSEVDIALRRLMLANMPANNYLFLYSGRFADYDNAEYFGETLVKYVDGVQWSISHADHLPDLNYYMFGKEQ